MLHIAVTTDIPFANPQILCPGAELRWGDCRFSFNPPDDTACDYWIVWAGLSGSHRMSVAPMNTLFLAGEPPAKKVYPRGFYAQFHRLVCARADYPHPRVSFDALGLNWHVGYDRRTGSYAYGYDHLASMPRPVQPHEQISVICSNLTTTQGQRDRLALLDALKNHFGDRIAHFGRGYQPIDDKLDAILGYRYHLVLENSISDDYWTEKLADAYLGWAYPLYVGCENLDRYFPKAGYLSLTGLPPSEMIQRLEMLLDQGLQAKQIDALAQSRDAILNRYNPFAWFAELAERFFESDRPKQRVVVRSHKAFRSWGRGLLYRMKG